MSRAVPSIFWPPFPEPPSRCPNLLAWPCSVWVRWPCLSGAGARSGCPGNPASLSKAFCFLQNAFFIIAGLIGMLRQCGEQLWFWLWRIQATLAPSSLARKAAGVRRPSRTWRVCRRPPDRAQRFSVLPSSGALSLGTHVYQCQHGSMAALMALGLQSGAIIVTPPVGGCVGEIIWPAG